MSHIIAPIVVNMTLLYRVTDCVFSYLSDLARIEAPEYLPTEQDILRARAPTTGILEYPFDLDGIVFRYLQMTHTHTFYRKSMLKCSIDKKYKNLLENFAKVPNYLTSIV